MLRETLVRLAHHIRLPHKTGDTTPLSPPKEATIIIDRQERDAKTFRVFCAGILMHPTINAYAKMGLQTTDVQSYFTTQFMRHLLQTMSTPDPAKPNEKITEEEKNVTARLARASGLFIPPAIQTENPIQPRALQHTARGIAIIFVRGLRNHGMSGTFATELNTSLDAPPENHEPMDDSYKPNLTVSEAINHAIEIYKRDMGF